MNPRKNDAMRLGQSVEDADVAENYRFRPEYPVDVYEKLVALSPSATNALDLGCGTGKIARGLSQSFESVTAIDASASMLRVATELQDEGTSNIRWVQGLAESTDLVGGPFDLVVAAASIHWMDQEVVFPRLLDVVSSNHLFAVIEGDGAYDPPWQQDWDDFLKYWIFELKREQYEPQSGNSAHHKFMTRYRQHVNIAGDRWVMSGTINQKLSDFILCQHSRDTFAPSKLGARIRQFDAELESILRPFAVEDLLSYRVRTSMTWGTIRDKNTNAIM